MHQLYVGQYRGRKTAVASYIPTADWIVSDLDFKVLIRCDGHMVVDFVAVRCPHQTAALTRSEGNGMAGDPGKAVWRVSSPDRTRTATRH